MGGEIPGIDGEQEEQTTCLWVFWLVRCLRCLIVDTRSFLLLSDAQFFLFSSEMSLHQMKPS